MTAWETLTWDVARSSGFLAYILFSASVAVGLALAAHWQNAEWPRLINAEMHNFLALVGLAFVGVHAFFVLIDPYTHFGLSDVLIPFASSYRTFSMAMGIVAVYLGIAIGISTLLRSRIGYATWRKIHVLTLLGYIGATIHGLGSGTDANTWWSILIYLGSTGLIGILLTIRLLVPATAKGKSRPGLATVTGLLTVVLWGWALFGPLHAL